MGRDSSVGRATRYGLDSWIESRWGQNFPHPSSPALEPIQPPIKWVPVFPGFKERPERDVDHPPASSDEVKERVELYLYSPSRPSWPVLGWILSLPSPLLIHWTEESTSHTIGFKWLNDCKSKELWKESVMPTFPILSWHLPGENEEYHEKPLKIVGALAEIWIRYFPNSGQKKPRRFSQLARSQYTDNSPTYATVTFRKTWGMAKFTQVGIEYANGQLCVNIKEIQLTSKLQHTGTWSAAVLPVRRLCCRPAVFYRHLCLIALSLP